MKSLLRNLIFRLGYKRVDESRLEIQHLSVTKESLRYFSLSTNTIVSFERDGQTWYFRECPRVLPFREYCVAAVDRFFDSLHRLGINEEHFKQEIPIPIQFSDEVIRRFREDVDRRMTQEAFFTAMANVDTTAVQNGFSIWDNPHYDSAFLERLGFPAVSEELLDISIFFLWYMRAVASGFKTLRVVRGKYYSHFNAVRSVASAVVAQETGLTSLITDAQYCELDIDGNETLFGVLSASARGSRMVDDPVPLTGALQRDLLNLHALDVIVHQPDHGPNNYNVWVEGERGGVCAFDNDNPHTFFPFFSVGRSLAGCSPLVDGRGMVARPYFDKDTAKKLSETDVRRLKSRLKPYLNTLQIVALVSRLKKLNRAIGITQEHRELLLASDAFNDETVRAELDGNHGITYLTKAKSKT